MALRNGLRPAQSIIHINHQPPINHSLFIQPAISFVWDVFPCLEPHLSHLLLLPFELTVYGLSTVITPLEAVEKHDTHVLKLCKEGKEVRGRGGTRGTEGKGSKGSKGHRRHRRQGGTSRERGARGSKVDQGRGPGGTCNCSGKGPHIYICDVHVLHPACKLEGKRLQV